MTQEPFVVSHAGVIFLVDERMDMSTIYCTNAVTEELETRGATDGSSNWSGSHGKLNLRSVKWGSGERTEDPLEVPM